MFLKDTKLFIVQQFLFLQIAINVSASPAQILLIDSRREIGL